MRSVLASATQKRIYVGGINEFGYYEPVSYTHLDVYKRQGSMICLIHCCINLSHMHGIPSGRVFPFGFEMCIRDRDNGGNVHFPQGMEQNTGLGLHAIFSGDHKDGTI